MDFIEIDEEQLCDVKEIAKELFSNESDPTSINYKRELNRPEIKFYYILIYFLTFIVLIKTSQLLASNFEMSKLATMILVSLSLLLFLLLTLKKVCIYTVKIYQRFAPDFIRRRCRFEPSCSYYMIESIEKLGVIKGIRKGLNRINRCKSGDGGFDEV